MTDAQINSVQPIDLQVLGEEPGLPGLTAIAGRFLAESAAVCLENQDHAPGAIMTVSGMKDLTCRLNWTRVTEQMRRTYNDLQEAIEDGAYGIAILLIRLMTEFTVVERSRKGSGVDYWLGPDAELPFQNKARLEVSGMLSGTSSQIRARLKTKLQQTTRSETTKLPAYVVIVEFSQPHAETGKQ